MNGRGAHPELPTVPRPDNKKRGVQLWLWVALVLLAFAMAPRLFGGAHGALINKPAPAFSMKLVANAAALAQAGAGDAPTQVSLDDLRGRAVILDFWATWCGPCQAEAPILNKVAERYKDKGLVVIGVNTSEEDGYARPWALRHGITYPITHDDANGVADKYLVKSLPTLVFISRDGKVLDVKQGLTEGSELERLVQKAL